MNLIDRLKENPENPRTISKEKFEKLKNNLQNFPKMLELRPIVYNKDFVVLGGNMRLKAIKELLTEKKIKLKDSYFKKAESLTKDEQDKFIVLDNQEFGDWDFDSLANLFNTDDLIEWGFDEKNLGINDKEQKDLSDKLNSVYEVVISCVNEREQEKIYNDLKKEGYECRILTL